MTVERIAVAQSNVKRLFGTKDENLRYLEQRLDIKVSARGNEVALDGSDSGVAIAARLIESFDRLLEAGGGVTKHEFRTGVRVLEEDISLDLVEFFLDSSIPEAVKRYLVPRNLNQRLFIRAVASHDYVFATGPAGTGKTYLAVAMASASLMEKEVRKIILVRPAVEAGEHLGFLPGDLIEKINPYLRPVYDALYDLMGYEKVSKLIERQAIEIAPLAFMRGRTLNDAFIILDEAQNTTREQMKMFLTRIGFGSTAVITGDATQIDLPRGVNSGLWDAERLLKDISKISFNYFTSKDVVRHPLVASIIEAYEADEPQNQRS